MFYFRRFLKSVSVKKLEVFVIHSQSGNVLHFIYLQSTISVLGQWNFFGLGLFAYFRIFWDFFFIVLWDFWLLTASSGFAGGGGVFLHSFSLRDSTPFTLFWDILFWLTDPKNNFLKAPLAPIYTNFEGGVRAEKKRDFLVTIFQKVPQKAFLGLFLKKKLPAVQKIWSKWGFYRDLGALRKSIWST